MAAFADITLLFGRPPAACVGVSDTKLRNHHQRQSKI